MRKKCEWKWCGKWKKSNRYRCIHHGFSYTLPYPFLARPRRRIKHRNRWHYYLPSRGTKSTLSLRLLHLIPLPIHSVYLISLWWSKVGKTIMSALQTFRPLKRNRTETELGVPTKLGGSKCWNRGSWSQFIRCSRGWERVNRDIKPYRDTVEIGFAAAKKKTKKNFFISSSFSDRFKERYWRKYVQRNVCVFFLYSS